MRSLAIVAALVLSASAYGALPGVVEIKSAPERMTDAELSTLHDPRLSHAHVVSLGETLHSSSGLLKQQTRLIRYLVAKHGYRLVVWENPTLRSVELAKWVSSCTQAVTPPPVEVL